MLKVSTEVTPVHMVSRTLLHAQLTFIMYHVDTYLYLFLNTDSCIA